MSELPKNWAIARIGDICQAFNGRAFKSSEWVKEGIPIIRIQNLKSDNAGFNYFQGTVDEKNIVRKGDLLFAWSGTPGTSFGAHIWKGNDAALNQHIFKIAFDPNCINTIYFCHALNQNVARYVEQAQGGVGLAHITKTKFDDSLIPLPPLDEQKRIVAKIEELFSELDSGIESLKKARAQLKVYRQACLNDAFAVCDKIRKLSELLSEKLSNGYSGKPVKHETPFRVISLSATTTGVFLNTHYKFLDEKGLEKRDIWCVPNDILIQRGNTSDYVGVSAIYNDAPNKFIFPDLMIRARANESLIKTKYLYYALSSPRIRNYLRRSAKGSAGTMPKVNQAILNATPIPFCDLAQQQQIIDRLEEQLSIINALESTIDTELQKSEALRQSILKKAFSGQLVAQDTKDEPASALLKRIRAEKTVAKPAKFSKKPAKKTSAQPAKIIAFPNTIASITTTDLHAGIIGMAYDQHEQNPRMLNTFGHVKAEKISHLVEYHLGIPLGRVPVKDAAGPNDYRHLKKVEHRANMANWFSVQQRPGGEGYVFAKKRGFDGLIAKTSQALGDKAAEVEALIRLLLPLNTQQAEIVATLYAAWNNLLIAGNASPADEEIVTEARENWHASKLNIDRDRFFRGLEWLRKKQLTPKGMGTIVDTKGARTA